ncbi:uncharacterized protein LOC123682418 [Harmonia axyridis]|uniref:uncharacterized protein LOC123682418 n=1 Tax=Harmonia axyridis TaxID=115357 RepID=UPI001E27709F|nr:uncharacterized protein LOC123682418 [Harmonia axyridis]
MVRSKILKNRSIVDIEEEVDTASEVFVGETYRKECSGEDINRVESKEDEGKITEVRSASEIEVSSLSSGEESSKFRRCLANCKSFSRRCYRLCGFHLINTELFVNTLIPIIFIGATVAVVTILSSFGDNIHQKSNIPKKIQQKSEMRYPLL